MTHKKIALLLVVVVVFGLGIYLFKTQSAKNSAFSINGTNYSKAEISEMASFAAKSSGFSRAQETKNIFELYKVQAAAQKAGITPNDTELKTASKTLHFASVAKPADKQYVKLITYNIALTNQTYNRYAQGGYEGDMFVFDFSQKILPPAFGVPPIPGYGDPALIKKDKNYALQQAQKYYAIYKKDNSTVKKLDSELMSNRRDGYGAVATSFDSAVTKSSLSSQIYYSDIYKFVTSQTKPGLGAIKLGRVSTKLLSPTPEDYADGYYYFVNIRKALPVIADPGGKVMSEIKKLQVVYRGV
jgi:hypothetical protein